MYKRQGYRGRGGKYLDDDDDDDEDVVEGHHEGQGLIRVNECVSVSKFLH